MDEHPEGSSQLGLAFGFPRPRPKRQRMKFRHLRYRIAPSNSAARSAPTWPHREHTTPSPSDLDWSAIRQVADVHDRARCFAAAGLAIGQKLAATLRSHVSQAHRCEFSEIERRHAWQIALSPLRQQPPPCEQSDVTAARSPLHGNGLSRPFRLGKGGASLAHM